MSTFVGAMRDRVAVGLACPTCHQVLPGASMRETAEAIGIPHTVLWRFLRGADMTGRNLDKIYDWLTATEEKK